LLQRSPSFQDEEKLLEALVERTKRKRKKFRQSGSQRRRLLPRQLSLLAGKVVNLTDLLPPIPDKGTFEVESIKESQYFFS
jgi:DNA-directed RNA polymerase